jgi:hypothetical protein
VPNYGLAAIAQNWLGRWEKAQAARYAAWTGAPSPVAGVTAVIGTAGSMFTGSGTGFAAVQRWQQYGAPSGVSFR